MGVLFFYLPWQVFGEAEELLKVSEVGLAVRIDCALFVLAAAYSPPASQIVLTLPSSR